MTPATRLRRSYLQAVVWLVQKAKSASVRLTRYTGKSRVAIHPKHLVEVEGNYDWYLAALQPGMRLLDVGCGNGMQSLRAVRQRGVTAVGVEGNIANLAAAVRLASDLPPAAVSFLQADLEAALPVSDASFDAVLLLDVIEHIVRRQPLLREIHRVLCPGGLLLVSAPNRQTRWKRALANAGLFAYADPDHKVEYTLDELYAELRQGGFEVQGAPLLIVYDTPWTGLIDLTAALSLDLYRYLSTWKARLAQRYPGETTGWRLVCRRI
ncbi:MAG TPA: methyltransferase domain-containing protein [Caldilineaceae bacterium]|nr:methyltransferase domain-containing protein [Caldilineaceae bacterium]